MTVVWCPLAEEPDQGQLCSHPPIRATLMKCFPSHNSCVCVWSASTRTRVTWSRNRLEMKSIAVDETVLDVLVGLVHSFPDRPSMRANSYREEVQLGEAREALFVLSPSSLRVYYLQGGHVAVPLPFRAAKMFETKYGLLLERDTSRPSALPTWLVLTHPLDDLCRLLVIGSANSGNSGIYNGEKSTVLHVQTEPSICIIFSQATGLHSLMALRLSTPEERVVAEKTMTSLHGASNATPHWASKSIGSPFNISGRSSLPYSPSVSVGGHARHPHHLSSLASVSRSPFSAQISLQTEVVNTLLNAMDADAIAPEFFLSMDETWTEPLSVAKSNGCQKSSKVFFSRDLSGQYHLCMHNSFSRKLLIYDTDESCLSLISKYPGCINCLDAEPIASLKMMVVLENQASTSVNNSLCLYSGVTRVARVAFDATIVHSDQQLAHEISIMRLEASSNTTKNASTSCTTPGATGASSSFHSTPLTTSGLGLSRSSTMSNSLAFTPVLFTSTRPSSAIDPKLEDSLSNLSPVISSAEDVFPPSRASAIHGLTRVLGDTRVGVVYNNGCVLKLHFPPFCTSHLIEVALDNLCHYLSPDVAQTLKCGWYASRHAPGPSCLSPSQEWGFFARFVLKSCGYDPGRVRLFPMCFDCAPSHEQLSPKGPKKVKPNEQTGCNEDWNYLMRSSHHNDCDEAMLNLLGLRSPIPVVSSKKEEDEKNERGVIDDDNDEVFSKSCVSQRKQGLDEGALLFNSLPDVLRALHELFNTVILDESLSFYAKYVAGLTFVLASDLDCTPMLAEYGRHFDCLCQAIKSHQLSSQQSHKLRMITSNVSEHEFAVISIFRTLRQGLEGGLDEVTLPSTLPTFSRINNLMRLFRAIKLGNENDWAAFIMTLKEAPLNENTLLCLPSGIELVIRAAIAQAATKTNNRRIPATITDKEDTSLQDANRLLGLYSAEEKRLRSEWSAFFCPVTAVIKRCSDGVSGDISADLLRIRWNKDARFQDAINLLISSMPVPITIVQKANVSDHEFIEEQERALLAKCVRTMALPVGRGALTLFTSYPLLTERILPPELNLKGRAPPLGKTVDMEHIDVVPDMTKWPVFHNGVAAGLKVCLAADRAIDSTWIAFNNPDRQAANANSKNGEHAGVLLGLGLGGHLAKLDRLESFAYIVRGDELTSIGLLLGLASSSVGSTDNELTRMISTQLPPLLSADSSTAHVELPVTINTQVAAMISLGLIYLASGHRRMAEVCLRELTRAPTNSEDGMANVDRESYSLASGLALGMITFGQGEHLCKNALADLHLPQVLRHAMDGGPIVNHGSSTYMNNSNVNVDLTGPGAIMALGMLFFNSDNKAVASWLSTPSTSFTLEFVRPDLLMLRTIAKGLVLFNSIEPSYTWLRSHVPPSFLPLCLVRPEQRAGVDHETLNQVYCNVTTGAALVMAIKFASSNNNSAFEAIYHHTLKLLSIQKRSLADLIGRSLLEQSICVHVLSLAIVMAGSGDLETLRLIRHLSKNKGVNSSLTYGSHLALSLALGLLFLGGGRLGLKSATFGPSSDPKESALAISAMVIAFFPKFPTHSSDNRYHLQALRHMYALTTEPRLLAPASVTNSDEVELIESVEVELEYRDGNRVTTTAPLLLPDPKHLSRLIVKDSRFYHRPLDLDRDLTFLKRILIGQCGVWPLEVRRNNQNCVLDESQLSTHTWHTKNDLLPWDSHEKLRSQGDKELEKFDTNEKRDHRVAAIQIASLLLERPKSFAPFMDVWAKTKTHKLDENAIVKTACTNDACLLSSEMDAALYQLDEEEEALDRNPLKQT